MSNWHEDDIEWAPRERRDIALAIQKDIANRKEEQMVVCDSVLRCKGWEKNSPKITAAQEMAANHGMEYDGDVYKFCPWCGKERTWVKSIYQQLSDKRKERRISETIRESQVRVGESIVMENLKNLGL